MEVRANRILVVDDERFFRDAIRDALQGAGLTCQTAANGLEALELAEEPDFGVVVLDIQMPGITGLEVLRRLRDSRPALRVIILSAHTDQETVLEALRLGATDYLAKPLHDEELVLAVRRALEAYSMRSDWERLQQRLGVLASRMAQLVEIARSELGDVRTTELHAAATEAVGEVLDAGTTSLMLFDADRARLRVAAATGRKLPPEGFDSLRVGEGVAGLALARSEPVLVGDVRSDERFAGLAPEGRYASRSFAVAPIEVAQQVVGVLCATDRPGDAPFEETDLSLLRILALQIGQLLAPPSRAHVHVSPQLAGNGGAGAELPDVEEEPADPAAQLAREICEAVTSEVEPARVIAAALRPVAAALEADPVALYLRDPGSGDLVLEGEAGGASDRPRLAAGRGLTGTVLASGRLVACENPEQDPRFDASLDTPKQGGRGPLLCLPLRFRGKVLGVVRAFQRPGATPSPRTGEVLAAALSAAIRNVLLYRSLVASIEDVAQVRREIVEAERGAP